MSELPRGWAEAALPSVCNKITDGTHHSPENLPTGDFKYVTAKNIRPWGLDLSNISYVDAETHREIYARCPVEKGDVLYIKDGATTGLAVINPLDEPFSMLSSVALLKPRFEALESSYLKYWLNSPTTLAAMLDQMTGTAIRRLTLTTISAQTIPIAPLPEQRRIVAKVDGLTARTARARKELNRIPTLIARYKQRLLALAFSGELTAGWRRLGGLSFAWDEAPLSELASVGTGATPKRGTADYYDGGTIPWVTSGVVNDDIVSVADQWITPTAIKETNCKVFPTGTLIVAMYGEGKTRGKVAVLGIDAATNQALAAIQLTSGFVTSRFVFWFFKSNYLQLREQAAGGVQPNLSIGLIKHLAIPIPPLEEQAEIVRRIESAFGWLDRMAADHAAAARLLPKLDAAILTKAFQGKLVPQDPNDEPAAKLLERIKAERSLKIKPKILKRNPKENLDKPPFKHGTFKQVTRRIAPETTKMTKSRQDDDVRGQPYLANKLKDLYRADVQTLFRDSDLPVADFYKQLAWEIDKGHILDNPEELKAA